MRRTLTTLFTLPLILLAGAACRATEPFPFVIPWDDASRTALDVSFLNSKPAGANGFITVKNGHFAEGKTGKRVRFLATNITGGDCWPSHEDAEKIAGRLAKYGVNLVRLHHMDNSWSIDSGGSIWDKNFKDRRHIDPAHLERLDYFISQLKKNGVYVNINLHVSRKFVPESGFPDSVNDIPFDFDKRVDYFDSTMVALQKEYAKDLLTHVNPYTKKAYVDEPGVLNVELTNEDSLVGEPWGSIGNGLGALPEPFKGELQGLWNNWLARHYKSTKDLMAARKLVPISGPSLLRPAADPSHWTLETQGETKAAIAADGDAIKAEVTKPDDTDWHIQLHQTGLDFQEGEPYTLSFRAKALSETDLPVGARLDQADWHGIGLDAHAHLTTEWKTFRFAFQATSVVPNHGRISFVLGKQPMTVWIADVELRHGDDRATPGADQTLEAGTIALPENAGNVERADWLEFLTDTEKSYVTTMGDYLRKTLKLHALIGCSPAQWGGLSGIYRESLLDINDSHSYWEHPEFPNKPWDAVDWRVRNTSMVRTLGNGDTLSGLVTYRNMDKPFTVTEYNHPAPNEYQAEMMPLFAAVGALQDWDALYTFAYGYAKSGDIGGFFDTGSNPAKWAFMPSAALIFRQAEIPAAKAATVAAIPKTLTGDYFAKHQEPASAFTDTPLGEGAAYARRVGVRMGKGQVTLDKAPSPLSYVNTDPKTAQFTADTPAAKAVVGFVAGRTVAVGDASFTFGEMPNGFASLTLVSLDEKPLANSSKALLTVADRVENTDMQWNAAHNSVNDHWGHGPAVADGVPVTVALKCDGPRKVSALDATGAVRGSVASKYENGELTFSAGPEHKTLWYVIEKK
jgi:hypothetical protein